MITKSNNKIKFSAEMLKQQTVTVATHNTIDQATSESVNSKIVTKLIF